MNKAKSYRQLTDPVADDFVLQVYKQFNKNEIGKLYRNLLTDIGEINYEHLPETFRNYFENNQQIPKWIDYQKIKIAEDLFFDVGAEYSTCLILRALPVGYTSANVVKLLSTTGYLASDKKTGTAKRLLETSQFLFNMMRRDSIHKDSPAMKHILKVRFIHAMVRYHMRKHQWDNEKFGMPINQEDMSLTILTFSVGAILGLDRLNINLTLKEKDALVHYWAIVGSVIGVEEAINPRDYRSGLKYYEDILFRQANKCLEGEQLLRALSDFITATFNAKWTPDLSDYMIRYLIGNDFYSNIIGLNEPKGILQKTTFNNAVRIIKGLNKRRNKPLVNRLIKPANKFFAESILEYFDSEFDLKLDIPEELRISWGIK